MQFDGLIDSNFAAEKKREILRKINECRIENDYNLKKKRENEKRFK